MITNSSLTIYHNIGLQDAIPYTEMPTANETNLGQIAKYIGETTLSYTKGHYYKCVKEGTVYFSEEAIKTIVNNETDSTLFFCTYKNRSSKYIKKHDEPLAYKVVDYELFKKHIDIVKGRYDNGECCRNPIVWELYRNINDIYINQHILTENCIVINDESCDIDCEKDVELLRSDYMVKALEDFIKVLHEEAETPQQKQMLNETLQRSMR